MHYRGRKIAWLALLGAASLAFRAAAEETLYQQGAARYERKDYAGAAELFVKALGVESNNAEVCRMAGLSYRRLGDNTRALEYLRRAVELDPAGIPGQYARHTVMRIENGLSDPSPEEMGPAYFPGYDSPSDGERWYRPRVEKLPDLGGTPSEAKVRELKQTLLASRFRLAAAPDELEMHRAAMNELRTSLTPVGVIAEQVKKIEKTVQAWAEAALALAELYAGQGNAEAAREAVALVRDSPFMRRGRPDMVTALPAYQEALKRYGP